MSTALKTFYGQSGGPKVYEGRLGYQDDTLGFDLYTKTRPVQPGGVAGEAVFSAFFLAVTWTMAVTLRVTPIVDGVAYDGTNGTTDERVSFDLDAQTSRTSRTFLLPMMRRLLDTVDPEVTVSRFFFRGTRIQALIESVDGIGDGTLILDRLDVEAQPVTDTKTAVTP